MSSFWHYLTLPYLLEGISITAQIAGGALLGGLLLGALLASLQALPWRPVRMLVLGYQGLARGTPLILQLVFVYDALPRVGITLSAVVAAIVALSFNESSFVAEIIRSSVLGVDRRQRIAAASVGMTPWVTLRRIVGPQALRLAVPALGSETISLLKNTSLASVISAGELTLRSEQLVAQDFAFFSIFFASGAMYLGLTAAVAGGQHALERWLDPDRRADRLARTAGAHDCVEAPPVQNVHLPRGETLALGRPVLEVHGLAKTYGSRPVLAGVDLVVHPGEVVVVMGASGSGKSTLLRLIDGLEEPDGGEIRVAGIDLSQHSDGRRAGAAAVARSRTEAGIGMVFQHFDLFAHLSAQDNVASAPIMVHREEPATALRQARALLAAVGLAGHSQQLPHQLSGGQQQRVAIARALALRPRLMLFDEPTSALDPELVGEVLAVIRRLAAESMTMIIVTHEVRFARQVADRVVFLADGCVAEDGPAAQVLSAPRHQRTRQFLQLLEEAPVGLPPGPVTGPEATGLATVTGGLAGPARLDR